MSVPFEIQDREVAVAAGKLREARAALARGEAPGNPLSSERQVSSRAAYLEIAAGDPLRDALRAWVYTLTLARVLWNDTAHLEAARRATSIQIDHADIGRLEESPRSLLLRILAEPPAGRRRAFAEALSSGAAKAADAARIYAERRAEAARRLPADPDMVEIPCAPSSALKGIAEALLRRTEPFVDRGAAAYHDVIAESVGRALADGWPARLTPRWIEELFRPTGLTEGLPIDLPRLPAALGASSFARALASFGAALADADGPESAPFVLARPPFDLRRARRAALFGALPADPIFGARVLGLGRGRARDQARSIARALLVSVRLDAARVLLRGVLELPERARASRFEEVTAFAIGAPIPASLAGVVPRLSEGDPTALFGALLAAKDRRDLIERFDDDWFRSPHAARGIREEDAVLPPSPRAPAEALEAGLDALTSALEAC